MVHPFFIFKEGEEMKCPYCKIEYNSPETYSAHAYSCYYKNCSISEQVDYDFLTYQELKDIATEKGIKVGNIKKIDIVKALKELED